MKYQCTSYQEIRLGCDQQVQHQLKSFDKSVSHLFTRKRLVSNEPAATMQARLFINVNRWASSRSWRLAMTLNQLDEYFSAIGVTVVLVGQARHLDQARNLAAELRMPFELISESHDSVQSLAKVLGLKSDNDNPSFLLTDLQGYPFYWQDAGELTLLEQLKRVLFAVRLLRSQILRHQEKMT